MSWGIERPSFQDVLIQPPAISSVIPTPKTIAVILWTWALWTTTWITLTAGSWFVYNQNQISKQETLWQQLYNLNAVPLLIFSQYETLPTIFITSIRIWWATITRTVTSRICITSSSLCLPLRRTATATITPWSPVYENKKFQTIVSTINRLLKLVLLAVWIWFV